MKYSINSVVIYSINIVSNSGLYLVEYWCNIGDKMFENYVAEFVAEFVAEYDAYIAEYVLKNRDHFYAQNLSSQGITLHYRYPPGYFFRSSPLAFCSSIFFTTSAICAPASTPGIPPRWILEITVRLASGMPTLTASIGRRYRCCRLS